MRTLLRILSVYLFVVSPTAAEERRFAYGVVPQTPCVADFEDFLELAFINNPLYDGEFLTVWDLDDDRTITFSDFLLFASDFGKRICVDLKKVASVTETGQVVTGGVPENATRIHISFSTAVRSLSGIPGPSTVSVFARVIDLGSGEPVLRELELQSIQPPLNLKVGGLISNGSVLRLSPWKFALAGFYRTPSGELTLASDLSAEWATLGLRPFKPTDVNLFTLGAYAGGAPLAAAQGPEPDEPSVRSALRGFLEKRFLDDATGEIRLTSAMEVFDNSALSRVPNPVLRAGLISLSGTFCEGAIQAILSGPIQFVDFGTVSSGDYAEVQASVFGDRGAVVDNNYKSEHFSLFGPVFARLALQEDQFTGREEEIAGSAILSLVAMRQALTDSSASRSGTELARRINTQMLARLNSGSAGFPNIGIQQISAGEVFPGGSTFASLAAVFNPVDSGLTPGNALLSEYMLRIVPDDVTFSDDPGFDDETLFLLDRYQDVIGPDDLVRIARILNLDFRNP
jgi:hypothetical protein